MSAQRIISKPGGKTIKLSREEYFQIQEYLRSKKVPVFLGPNAAVRKTRFQKKATRFQLNINNIGQGGGECIKSFNEFDYCFKEMFLFNRMKEYQAGNARTNNWQVYLV